MKGNCPVCGDPFPCLKHGLTHHETSTKGFTMRTTRARATVAALAAVAVLGLSAASCDNNKASEPFKDAPRSGINNGAPMDVVRGSDGFSNVGTKCDHGNRIYVAYHGDSPYAANAVVPQDPTCN